MKNLIWTTLGRGLLGLFFAAAVILPPAAGQDSETLVSGGEKVAIRGYDPVAYFTEGHPVKGNSDFETSWNDVRWRFASAAHQDLFVSDPERYSPQFGGLCAWGVAIGKHFDADPESWAIVEGKLYLTYGKAQNDKLQANLAGNIEKANANWAAYQAGQ